MTDNETTNGKCAYCDPERQTPCLNYRSSMCPSCREDYDDYLEDKADADRDERLIQGDN